MAHPSEYYPVSSYAVLNLGDDVPQSKGLSPAEILLPNHAAHPNPESASTLVLSLDTFNAPRHQEFSVEETESVCFSIVLDGSKCLFPFDFRSMHFRLPPLESGQIWGEELGASAGFHCM